MRSEARHQLKHDKFADTAKDTYWWAMGHRRNLIAASAIAIVVIAAVAGWWAYQQRREELAGLELGAAIRTLNAPLRLPASPADPEMETYTSVKERALAAEKTFQAVAAKFAHTKSGEKAAYFAGISEMQANENGRAESQLKQSAASRNQDIFPLAKLALASLYHATGRDSEAIPLYRELVERPSRVVPKATAQLQLAELYQAKQPQEARRIYEQVQKEDPAGPGGEIAMMRMAALKQ